MDRVTDATTLEAAELRDLIVDNPQEQRFDVSRRIFHDPEVFDLEIERIFETNWVYLAHESQLLNEHDYFSTQIGRQPVVVTRAADGKINAFINACSHRGAQLTVTKRGNKPTFMCPYHGWVYDSEGTCVDVNDHANGHYPEYFNSTDHDLRKLGQVGVYRGFIFGSIVEEVEPLETWLGDASVFIDMFVDQSPDGLEVLKGGVHYTTTSNWKLQLENPDGYHFFPVHTGYIALAARRGDGPKDALKTIDVSQMKDLPGAVYDLGHGHGTAWAWMPNGEDRPLAQSREYLEQKFDKERADWLIDCVRFQLLFPNLWLMDQSSTTLRIMHPIAVDKTRVEVYCIAPKGEPAEARALRLRQFEDFLGPAGLATPDDQVVMESCQRGFQGKSVKWQQGYARGNASVIEGPDEEAKKMGLDPVVSGRGDAEVGAHAPLRRWRELMGQNRD